MRFPRSASMLMVLTLAASLSACGASPYHPEQPTDEHVVSVAVLPAVADLAPSQSIRFVADIRDAMGHPVTTSITWRATGGIIDAHGTYVAGSTPGTYEVQVVRAGAVTGTSRVRIQDAPSTPPAAPEQPASPPASERGSAVEVAPGEDLEALVERHAAGTTFVLKAGRHPGHSVRPKDGMTFVGEPGAVLDGEHTTRFAFHGAAGNVTIRGLVIEHYAPGAQMGAVKAGDHDRDDGTWGWVVERCEIRYNDGGGIRTGHRMQILHNHIHHNSQIGIVGVGDDILVEGNEIAYNNFEREYRYGWEAGGTKFVKTRRLVVRDNWSHHNWGPGLWTDIDNIDTLYEGNLVEDNADSGIFHEISYRATIRNNTVRRNGFDRVGDWAYGAGILIAHSPDVEVYGNTLEDNHNGILGIQQDRGDGAFGDHALDNLHVHDNRVVQRNGQWAAGVAQDVDDQGVFDRNLRFERNHYVLAGDGRWFEWNDREHKADTWIAFGHDANGRFEDRGRKPRH
jgi:parallel beta-helix repeat protein